MTLAAVAQLTSTGVIADNLAVSVGLIKRAAAAGAKAIFLPEGPSVGQLTRSAEARSFVEGIQEAAQSSSIWVTIGIHEPPPLSHSSASSAGSSSQTSSPNAKEEKQRCFNTQLLIDSNGSILARYRKNHLFDVDIKGGLTILESDTTIPGGQMEAPQQSPIGNIGLLTCYDLRFPEPALRLRRMGAQILTYPSAFTVRTGAAHWEVLLRARAIETQSYVMAAAQVGAHAGTKRVSWGHAMIVDPYGSVVAQCSDMQPYQPTFCLADVDLTSLEEMRKEMPLWSQRRNDVYPEI